MAKQFSSTKQKKVTVSIFSPTVACVYTLGKVFVLFSTYYINSCLTGL